MNLNIFRGIERKEDKKVQNFTEELRDFLKNREIKNQRQKNEQSIFPRVVRNISLIQEAQDKNKITSSYKDKMNVERINILNNYAIKTLDKGTLYYVYSRNTDTNTYNLCICKEGKSHEIIEIEESKLPSNAGIDSALREERGRYILDEYASYEIQTQTKQMIEDLIKRQKQELDAKRIDGHIYEVVEKGKNNIWLIDRTIYDKSNADVMEEIEFPKDLLEKAKVGEKYKFENGQYHIAFT